MYEYKRNQSNGKKEKEDNKLSLWPDLKKKKWHQVLDKSHLWIKVPKPRGDQSNDMRSSMDPPLSEKCITHPL